MNIDALKTYTINEGKHFTDERFPQLLPLTNGIYGEFILGEETVPSFEHDHINKIVGLAVGIDHHDNSLRIGWMFSNDLFHLYAYAYHNGKRHHKFITAVHIGHKVEYYIAVIEGVPTIHVDDYRVAFDFQYDYSVKTGSLLFPYYGGQPTAPNTIKLKLSINS